MKTMRDLRKNIDLSALVLIISVSAVIAHKYFNEVDMPNFESRLELHNRVDSQLIVFVVSLLQVC
jgi:hypothetical protein